MITLADVLVYLVTKGPGRSGRELAHAIYGSAADQQLVNQECRLMAAAGKIEQRGSGSPSDPFRYFPFSSSGN
jgi:hypothetical protein